MQIIVAFLLLVIALALLWAWRTDKISNEMLNVVAAIFTVIAGLAAVVLFLIPGASPLSSDTTLPSNTPSAALFSPETSPTTVPLPNLETMYYGSRMGMVVTVVSKQGIDSNNAVITTEHTRENAIAFCRDYALSAQEQCIEEELATKLNSQISANCETGTFTNFYGEVHEFQGLNENGNASDPKYLLYDFASGEFADGSFASGYYVNLDIFRALCPGRFSKDY